MSSGLCRVGLIVTGIGEETFLHDLFNRNLRGQANCLFQIIRRIPQLPPATHPRKEIRITGTNRQAESWDQLIGLWAHGFLRENPNGLVVVLDDIEHDRKPVVERVFRRYRDALDSVMAPEMRQRASVHFLANMLEAYYFAHAAAVNEVAGAVVLDADHPGDVEQIRNPKQRLASAWPRKFRPIDDGRRIVRSLDLRHVLARPHECCWLRSMFAWTLDRFHEDGVTYPNVSDDIYCVRSGGKVPLTYPQRQSATA